jgi:hypothetical protein
MISNNLFIFINIFSGAQYIYSLPSFLNANLTHFITTQTKIFFEWLNRKEHVFLVNHGTLKLPFALYSLYSIYQSPTNPKKRFSDEFWNGITDYIKVSITKFLQVVLIFFIPLSLLFFQCESNIAF